MAKIIDITDKLGLEKPIVKFGEHEFVVNDSVANVLRFQALSDESTEESMKESIKLALGEKAVEVFNFDNISISGFRVLVTAIMAAMQGRDYDEVAARFQE